MSLDRLLVVSLWCVNCSKIHGTVEDATFRDVSRSFEFWADCLPCCPRCGSREVWVTLSTVEATRDA